MLSTVLNKKNNKFDELSINIDKNSIFRLRVHAIENKTANDGVTICVGVRGLIVEES